MTLERFASKAWNDGKTTQPISDISSTPRRFVLRLLGEEQALVSANERTLTASAIGL